MKNISDTILGPVVRFAHERLRLTPNQVSVAGLVLGIGAAGVAASGRIAEGLGLMALSQILDGVDGGIARRYGLGSARGATLETVFDRLNEFAMFLALAFAGATTFRMAILATVAILCVTSIERRSGFDPGFKRFMLYFGWLAGILFRVDGLNIALHVVFLANLAVFAVGTVIIEYRLQREFDDRAILERERMHAAGLSVPPFDPPTILSRLFSWLFT